MLILGETGMGKELLARAIHVDSARAKQPFVALNCARIPETLIEAELFGYEDGAFTGARRKGAVGKIVQANGGTLFLDEIGDMPLGLPAHLLDHKVFREDLLHRLNGLAVRLPPLRERSDLMALVRRILDQLAAPGGRPRRLQPDAEVLRLFEHSGWPGNVRQLFNVLRTAAVMAANEAAITREHLSDDVLEVAQATPADPTPVASVPDTPAAVAAAPVALVAAPAGLPPTPAAAPRWSGEAAAVPRSLEEIEIDAIRQAVDRASGNLSEASKRLGISRNTVDRKLRRNTPK